MTNPAPGARRDRGRRLAAATAFFVELGLTLQGEVRVEGRQVDGAVASGHKGADG